MPPTKFSINVILKATDRIKTTADSSIQLVINSSNSNFTPNDSSPIIAPMATELKSKTLA